MSKPAKKQREYLWHIKLHFLLTLGFLLIVTTSFSAYSMVAQLRSGLSFGISTFYLITGILAPLLAMVFSYLLTPKQKSRFDQWFWIILQALVAMIIYTVAQQLTMIISFLNMNVTQESWMLNEIARYTVSFIPVIIYFAYLYWLRKKLK